MFSKKSRYCVIRRNYEKENGKKITMTPKNIITAFTQTSRANDRENVYAVLIMSSLTPRNGKSRRTTKGEGP